MVKKSKPVIAVRRPPPSAKELDSFIQGHDDETSASAQGHLKTAPDVHQRSEASVDVSGRLAEAEKPRGLVLRQGGKERRRRTVYLPPELDQRLEEWCAEQGREVSHAIAEAVRKMLSGKR